MRDKQEDFQDAITGFEELVQVMFMAVRMIAMTMGPMGGSKWEGIEMSSAGAAMLESSWAIAQAMFLRRFDEVDEAANFARELQHKNCRGGDACETKIAAKQFYDRLIKLREELAAKEGRPISVKTEEEGEWPSELEDC